VIIGLSAVELLDLYGRKELSPVAAVEALAERIEAVEPAVNAFVTLDLERAREDARAAEREYRSGEPRPLAGLPVAVKDVFDTAGLRTTYGSAIFADHVPDSDAALVRRLRNAGAVVLGKTGTHEFAWGITSVNPHYGSPRNPWNTERISGGSSGGSGVAVACGEAPLALGSDTGGSTRVPAAFCGVVGLKPSYGLLPTDGLFPLAPSLDHAGLLARTPQDISAVLAALGYVGLRETSLRGVVVASCPDLGPVPLAQSIESGLADALSTFRELGAHVVELELPEARALYETFSVIQLAEALKVHETRGLFPTRAPEYGADVRGRLERATEVSLADYVEAAQKRRRLEAAIARLFERAALVVTPIASITAPVLSPELSVREEIMPFTTPQDLAGLPACAVRAELDPEGLPVGVQLTGEFGADALVLAAARAYVDATPEIQAAWPEIVDAP
jgi:aspartyl-tRNA(Asn)/glutamyl-tRNA(Gln) amidotransferase subunit A